MLAHTVVGASTHPIEVDGSHPSPPGTARERGTVRLMSTSDEELETTWPEDAATPAGGTDGTDSDSGDSGDTDGTDSGDTDGTDSGDTDGTDA